MSLQEILIRLTVAFVSAGLLTPLFRRLAIAGSLLDLPEDRKSHREPVPLLGGVALFVAVSLGLLVVSTEDSDGRFWGLLAAATLVTLTGLVDDYRGLPVLTKLLAQLAAAGILVAAGLFVDLALPVWVDGILTVLWIVGITNAFNLLDNMDGLAASVAAAAALGFLVLTTSQGGVAAPLAAAVLGATLGFLIHNRYPARIFMGDAGSFLLGLLLAVLGLELQTGRGSSEPWAAALVPVLVLAIPIFDTTLVTVSRGRRGHNPLTTPGRDHFSHRLARRGISISGVVLRVALAGVACSGLAVAAARSGTLAAVLSTGAVFFVGLWAVIRLDGPPNSLVDDVGGRPAEPDPTLER